MQPLAWSPGFLTGLPQSCWPLRDSGFTQQPVILFRICGPRVALLLTTSQWFPLPWDQTQVTRLVWFG